MTRVTGLILAGGRGSRLGRFKPTMPLVGRPLIAWPLDALRAVADEVIIAHGPEPHRDLVAAFGSVARLVPDPGEGPLGGLEAGLRVARGEWTLIASCDVPLVTREVFRLLLSRAADGDGAVPETDGHVHPLVAAYRTTALAGAVREGLRRGQRAVVDAIGPMELARVTEADLAGVPYGVDAVVDVDSPRDLQRVQAILGFSGRRDAKDQ